MFFFNLYRNFMSNRRPIKNIEQLLSLTPTARVHAFRSLSEEEINDILVVCKKMPKVDLEVNYEGKAVLVYLYYFTRVHNSTTFLVSIGIFHQYK